MSDRIAHDRNSAPDLAQSVAREIDQYLAKP